MLHFQTVTPPLLSIIRAFCKETFFAKFRLVGGTALSLHLGHRMSVDADFFSNEAFEKEEAIEHLTRILPGLVVLKKSAHGFAATQQGVKIDVYTWGTPFLLPVIEEESIRMADLPDLAALKLEAITNRKEEKDFRDVHALLQKFNLSELAGFFSERFPQHNLKILTDHLLAAPFVERDLTIPIFNEISWERLTKEIVQAVEIFYQEKLAKKAALEADRLRQRIEAAKKKKE